MTARLSAVVLLFVGSLVAESGPTARHIRIHVAFASGLCAVSTRVVLLGHSGPVAEGSADEECVVNFDRVPEGKYHLRVSGQNLPDADFGSIAIGRAGPDAFEVRVKGSTDAVGSYGSPASGLVSASDLAVPARARSEFERANELIGKENLKLAIQKLDRAIAIYPLYAAAYNNLGVIYSRLGDLAQARKVLEKAITLDDHFALAYLNLGRMSGASGDFVSAEETLRQAAELDPTEAITWVLLAYSEFMQGRFDEAIATSQKVHQLPGAHAYAHLVAAHAFLKKREAENAIAELQMFLREEPAGSFAERAREELATVEAAVGATVQPRVQ
ncbi:MAG TPA: tetratricopeptide repeat protein [Candidatus Acidoferrales bacterium]|nr:tetratricopeptide repeat protein [Candidatus Acidoferrales bacterium]